MTAITGTARLTPKRAYATTARASPAPSCTIRNSYGRSCRSALARSAASTLGACCVAIQTGAPLGSKRRRSCSLTSARVRYVTRAVGPPVSASVMARLRATMPYTTRATPNAAPIATSTITIDIAIAGEERSLGRRGREVKLGVHVVRPDSAGGHKAGACRIGLVRRRAVVLEGFEGVLQDRVVEKPEQVLRVACGHQHRQAAGHLRAPAGDGCGPHPDHVEVAEHRSHHWQAVTGAPAGMSTRAPLPATVLTSKKA